MQLLCLMFLLMFAATAPMSAQISIGGEPPSWNGKFANLLQRNAMPALRLDPIDNAAEQERVQKLGDEECAECYKGVFATRRPARADIVRDGALTTSADGDKLYTMRFSSPNANSMQVFFERFHLPPGGKLYIYETNRAMVLGAFTQANERRDGRFVTQPVVGDEIVVEYHEPANAPFRANIVVEEVTHDFMGLFYSGPYGNSGQCHVNVACSLNLGNQWEEPSSSVALILKPSGANLVALCTGALIGNTASTDDPYFLTANHCLNASSNTNDWVFMFHHESSSCFVNSGAPTNKSISGASILSNGMSGDYALLKLNSPPPPSYNVFYSGWDRSAWPFLSSNVTKAISHPSGDIKKIATDLNAPQIVGGFTGNNPCSFSSGSNYWGVQFDEGTVSPGSSGCPLFNSDRRIIGQLLGGCSDCPDASSGTKEPDWPIIFGRFFISWSNGNLGQWLDPGNIGVPAIDAYQPWSSGGGIVADFTPQPSVVGMGQNVSFLNQSSTVIPPFSLTSSSYAGYGYQWDFGDGNSATTVNPTHAYFAAGTYFVTLTIFETANPANQATISKQVQVVQSQLSVNDVVILPQNCALQNSPTLVPQLHVDFVNVPGTCIPTIEYRVIGCTNCAIQSTFTQPAGTYNYYSVTDVLNSAAVNPSAPVTYNIEVRLSYPPACGSSLSTTFPKTLTFYPATNIQFAGSNGGVYTFCPSNSLVLNPVITGGSGNFSYIWSPIDYLSDPTIPNPVCTSPSMRTYTLEVTDNTRNCVQNMSVVVVPQNPAIATMSDENVCLGSSRQLDATVSGGTLPYTYNWSPSSGLSCTNCEDPVVTPTAAGAQTYTLDVADASGCTASQTVNVFSASSSPTVVVLQGSSVTICEGESVTLEARGGSGYGTPPVYEFHWLNLSTMNTQMGASIQVSPATTTQYSVSVKDATTDCWGTSQLVTVNVVEEPDVTFPAISSAPCPNTVFNYTPTISNDAGYTWTWLDAANQVVSTGPSLSVTIVELTTHFELVGVHAATGCEYRYPYSVTRNNFFDVDPVWLETNPNAVCAPVIVPLSNSKDAFLGWNVQLDLPLTLPRCTPTYTLRFYKVNLDGTGYYEYPAAQHIYKTSANRWEIYFDWDEFFDDTNFEQYFYEVTVDDCECTGQRVFTKLACADIDPFDWTGAPCGPGGTTPAHNLEPNYPVSYGIDQTIINNYASHSGDYITGNKLVTVSQVIVSASTSSVHLRAEDNIRFLPGFQALSGSHLTAKILTSLCQNDGLLKEEALTSAESSVPVEQAISSLKGYPNPTTGMLNLDMDLKLGGDYDIQVYSSLGEFVVESSMNLSAGMHTIPIDLGQYANGVYYVRVISGKEVRVLKIAKI